MKKLIVFFIVVCATVNLWGQTYQFEGKGISHIGYFAIDMSDKLIQFDFKTGSDGKRIHYGKFRIITTVTQNSSGYNYIGFQLETIESKNNDNYDLFFVDENEVVLFNSKESRGLKFKFSNGDGNKEMCQKLKKEQFK